MRLAICAVLAATVLAVPPGPAPRVLAAQGQAKPINDLALVPADALAFIHMRAAELWKSDLLAGIRGIFEKAGPKALSTLDAQFVPKPSTFERLTAFVLLDPETKQPLPLVLLRFSAPFNPDNVVRAYLPAADKYVLAGKTIWTSRDSGFDLHFPDRYHILIGPTPAFTAYLKNSLPKSGGLSSGLKLAASGTRPVVASVSLANLPLEELKRNLADVPPEALPLFKARHLTAALAITPDLKVDITAGYGSAAEAQDAEKAVKLLADLLRKELSKTKAEIEQSLFKPTKAPRPLEALPEAVGLVFMLGALNYADELLANPGAWIKRADTELTATITLPKELVGGASQLFAAALGLALPAVQKVREAATRVQTQNNLKQIALAIHNYEAAYGHLPHDIVDKNGNPLLSWRVQILPFLEQENLYRQFKLDEPWNSPNNLKAASVVVKTYTSPQADAPPGLTYYKAFTGPGTLFERGKKIHFPDVSDGLSNTILVIEGGDPVPWAKPDDIPFDPKKPLPKLALPGFEGMVNVVMADGAVRTLSLKSLTEKTLKAAITRNGGEVLGPDWDK
jgi:hypothetical protein